MAAWLDTLIGLGFDARLNTYGTILVFLPIVLAGYWALPKQRHRHLWLAAASLVFYSFWDWRFTPLLVISSLFDFYAARRAAVGEHRKRWLIASIVFNLGMLSFFKYLVFAATSVNTWLDLLGSTSRLGVPDILLPVGISFFTFQTMSYTIDAYRGHVEPTNDLVKFVAYVSLFPQLVAGPIIRYKELGDQLDVKARFQSSEFYEGLTRFGRGLFKKVLLADVIASMIDPLWVEGVPLDAPHAWFITIGFMMQVYMDFSAYSDMAIGVGRMMGLTFPENFKRPFAATNPADFWRYWHMTLSRFIRDYLYIPLGGSRGTWRARGYAVIMSMTLSGLWHGAAWGFVLWGFINGVVLIGYQRFRKQWDAMPRNVQHVLWLALFSTSLIVFRSPSLARAGEVFRALVHFEPAAEPLSLFAILFLGGIFIASTWRANPVPAGLRLRATAAWPHVAPYANGILAGAALVAMPGAGEPFIYFQF